MLPKPKVFPLSALAAVLVLLVAACSSAPLTPNQAPQGASITLADVPGIVDPSNLSWPREVEGLNGRVTIPEKPERIVTLSVGHDEITYALVPPERVVGVGAVTQNPMFSNVSEPAASATILSREPEVILSVSPDLMVTSPFLSEDLVEVLSAAGLLVIQTQLKNDPHDRMQDILLIGYIYGEEDRAIVFAEEVGGRLDRVRSVVRQKSNKVRQRVMQTSRYSGKIYTAGGNSTEGGIITAAGGINVVEEAGLSGNPTISEESILAMRPDVILVTQPQKSGQEYIADLYASAALAEVPAIQNRQVFLMESRFFTTLSHWNIRGIEILAALLWPNDFGDPDAVAFSLP